jgi:hypothetical protein
MPRNTSDVDAVAYTRAVNFGVLGPVEVRHDGRSLRVGSARERLVLANA